MGLGQKQAQKEAAKANTFVNPVQVNSETFTAATAAAASMAAALEAEDFDSISVKPTGKAGKKQAKK